MDGARHAVHLAERRHADVATDVDVSLDAVVAELDADPAGGREDVAGGVASRSGVVALGAREHVDGEVLGERVLGAQRDAGELAVGAAERDVVGVARDSARGPRRRPGGGAGGRWARTRRPATRRRASRPRAGASCTARARGAGRRRGSRRPAPTSAIRRRRAPPPRAARGGRRRRGHGACSRVPCASARGPGWRHPARARSRWPRESTAAPLGRSTWPTPQASSVCSSAFCRTSIVDVPGSSSVP